jgi:hypothetical protein
MRPRIFDVTLFNGLDVTLSNGVKLTFFRAWRGLEVHGAHKLERMPNGDIPEPYLSEIRTVVDAFSKADEQNADAAELDPPRNLRNSCLPRF